MPFFSVTCKVQLYVEVQVGMQEYGMTMLNPNGIYIKFLLKSIDHYFQFYLVYLSARYDYIPQLTQESFPVFRKKNVFGLILSRSPIKA